MKTVPYELSYVASVFFFQYRSDKCHLLFLTTSSKQRNIPNSRPTVRVMREEADQRGYIKTTEMEIEPRQLSLATLQNMAEVAKSLDDVKSSRAIEAILMARDGEFDSPIPNFKAFSSTLEAYLKHKLIDGWVYLKKADGKLYPALVTNFQLQTGHRPRGRIPADAYLSPFAQPQERLFRLRA